MMLEESGFRCVTRTNGHQHDVSVTQKQQLKGCRQP